MNAPLAHPAASQGSGAAPTVPSPSAPGPWFFTHTRNIAAFCEADNEMTICGPDGNVKFSDRLLAEGFDEGRAWVCSFTKAAVDAHDKARRTA